MMGVQNKKVETAVSESLWSRFLHRLVEKAMF